MRSRVGSAWRDSISATGSCRIGMSTRQASTTSFASRGPHVDHAGHGPDRGQVLDRLVGRPVLADADRVVRVDVDQRELHQRGQPQRAALEVGEDQEPGLVGAQLGQRQPVRRPPPPRARAPRNAGCARPGSSALKVAGALERQPGLVRRRQVRRAADQPRHPARHRVEHLAVGVAAARRPWRRRGTSGCRRPSRRAASGAACG